MLSTSIPTKFNIPFANNATGPYIRPIPQASQVGITPGAASLYDGFPPVTFIPESSGGTPPAGADMNGLLNQVTQWVQWLNAGAPIFYDAAFQAQIGGYPKGALISAPSSTFWWLSVVENNLTNPNTGGVGWLQVVPASPSTTNPLVNGAAAPGTSLLFSRQDHIHPTDSSRAALSYVNSTFETIAAAAVTFMTKINPVSSGILDHTGAANIYGDITAQRPGSAANTGVIFLGNSGTKYLYYDGTNYVMPGAELFVNGKAIVGSINTAQATANTGVSNAATAQSTATTALNNTTFISSLLFGISQNYTDVTSIRAFGGNYTNSTGRPIFVSVTGQATSGFQFLTGSANGVSACRCAAVANSSTAVITMVVPPGMTYTVASSGNINLTNWFELR